MSGANIGRWMDIAVVGDGGAVVRTVAYGDR